MALDEYFNDLREDQIVRDMTDLEIYEDFVEGMTSFEGSPKETLAWATIGLTSEAGEVAGEVEKMLRKKEDLDFRAEKIFDECSDVLFYVTAVLLSVGYCLDDCIAHNIDKLNKRHGVVNG